MSRKSARSNTLQLTDWQLFTNNGNFNNPLPPNRRLKKRYPYFVQEIDLNSIRSRCQTARSRNQSAISTSTKRILSARSVNYRRTPRVKPVDLDLDEECVQISVYPSARLGTGRTSTVSSQRPHIWTPQAWSFSCLHRAIIAIDEQAKKDYEVGRTMNAIAAWQNALIYCEELTQRTQLWPENKALLDDEIATLKRRYREHMEQLMRKSKNTLQGNPFTVPTRKCSGCLTEQPLDQFHDRLSNVCQHVERTICNKCIYNNAKSLLEGSSKAEITCPEPQCTATFNPNQIRQLVSTVNNNELIETHNRQAKNQTLDRKSEFVWCAHEGCGSGQFHIMGQPTSSVVTCILCKQQTCVVHRVKWHQGITCTEYDRQNEPPPPIPTKECPGCHFNVEENSDSDHMLCPNCKYEFCCQCLADYKQIEQIGPHHHTTTCTHYQNNPKKPITKSKSSTCTIL